MWPLGRSLTLPFFGLFCTLTVGKLHPALLVASPADDRCKHLYKEKCAMERLCEDKQQVII